MVVAPLLVRLLTGANCALASKAADPFPVYPIQAPNVGFWKKVYGVYPTTQGILHDRRNLNIIYEVIPLEDPRGPGADRRNENRIQREKAKYQKMLGELAAGKAPETNEEKRVRALFAEKGSRALLEDARLHVRLQVGQQDRFRGGLVRSGMYLDEIKEIFQQYGLPQDLAYLPHVESSFDYGAYSKFGAAGIWQFTHGTGKRFLTIDYVVDERRDPVRATHAAARFLKENFAALGSWPLAITAYNHGTGGMLRAKRIHGDYESIFREYEGRGFGFASRNFYSEFLAAREIALNYPRYFGDLELAEPIRRNTVTIPGYVRVHDLARHFQVDEDTLRHYNPSLREPVFRGQKYVPKGFQLQLPARAGHGPASLARIPAEMIREQQKASRTYRVKRGDVAGEIARRHGVSLRELIAANGLNARATVYAGQNLRIPARGEKTPAAPKAPTPGRSTHEAARTVSGSNPPPAEKAEAPSRPATGLPTGAEHGPAGPPATPYPATAALEKPPPAPAAAPPEEGPPGPVEASVRATPSVVVGNFSVEKVFTRKGERYGVIRVEAEETLGHYAEWLQVPTRKIRTANRLSHKERIRVGQKIEVPFGKVTREQFEERRYEYHKEMEEDFFAAYTVAGLKTYRPAPGENVWTLCREKFDLPFWLLRKYNPETDFDRLAPSRPLVVPEVAGIGEERGPAATDNGADRTRNAS